MNRPRTHTSSQATASTTTKKRRASTETEIKSAEFQPATKKARVEADRPKMDSTKKSPACAACRKKKTKCGHRVEPHWVAIHQSSPTSVTDEPTQPSLSTNLSPSTTSISSNPVKVTNPDPSSPPTEPTRPTEKKANPAPAPAPEKFRKLDENRDATPEFRKRIKQDRNSCVIQFTGADRKLESRWASRVYGYYFDGDDEELPLHEASSETERSSAAGNTPSLSSSDTESSISSDIDTPQSLVEPFAQTYLATHLKDLVADACLESTWSRIGITLSEAERAWLREIESWTYEARALIYDGKASSNDWTG
ncbi:hypothetical protein IFR05_006974 [Cadophora sp. M221]|nr:hypothetical protein IFR05_006974 [Cadophora sp. M221]